MTKWANGSGADGTGRFGTGPYEGVENRLLSESDLEEYLAVGEREHVRNLKKEQIKAGESPILTTIGQVKSFIRAALSGNVRNTIKGYGKVGARLAEDLQAAGIDATGYYLELDANRIAHLSDHVTEDGDTRNIPLTQEQAENLAEYIDNYDDLLDVVRKKDGSIRIYLGKKINGHAVIVELLSKGRKSLQPVTAWQNKTEHYLKKYGKAKVQKGGDGKPPALPNQIDTSRPTADAADISGYKSAPSAISVPQENGDVNGPVEDGKTHYSLKDTAKTYEGKDLSKDGSVYGYEFLTSLPDMTVTSLPEVGTIQGKDGRINARTVVNLGMENARKVGVEKDGKVFVRNEYTGKQLLVTSDSIRHGLNGNLNRLLTNARLGTVIGDLVKNAVPVNALQNKADGVTGTYAMAGYARDSRGREFVGIITVEQYSGNVAGLEVYDVTHAVSGRQKRGERVDTKSQGFYPSTNASTISIADFLGIVKQTHQSILPEDVLAQFGEKRNPAGYYTGKAQFSLKNAETATQTATGEGEAGATRPLTQADAKRFASETGTENGLVLDDYVQKRVRPETAERLNTLAQALGVRVRFVGSIRGGTANASIRGNEVQIERYNPNPVTFLLGHELTHRMQQLSPEAYARFKEAVRSEAEKEAQGLHSLYRIRGENIDFEGAMDEATANYAGRLLEKGPVLDEFIQRHKTDRSLLGKLLDAVRDILSKLTGQERKQVETAESKLLEALEETAERVKEKAPGKNELTLSAGTDTLKNDLEVLEKRIKPTMTAQVEALPEEQKQALQDYTGFAATRINSAIRYGRITPEIQKKIDLLDIALKDGVMPETVVLHRDTSFAFIAQEIGLSGKPTERELSKIVRRTVTNDIFTSTSFKNLGLPGRDTEIWLTVPAGYRGCQFIQSVARPQFKDQVEVLFARGLRYKITDAKTENGKYILFAEVLK